jgi:hypothetical protein
MSPMLQNGSKPPSKKKYLFKGKFYSIQGYNPRVIPKPFNS